MQSLKSPSATEFTHDEVWEAFEFEERIYKKHLLDEMSIQVMDLMTQKAKSNIHLRGSVTAGQFAAMNPPELVTILSEEVRLTWKSFGEEGIEVEAYTSVGTWRLMLGF